MNEFLMENSDFIIRVVTSAITIVLYVIIFIRTGNKKYLEDLLMKFRTASYAENNPADGQNFDRFKPVYRLNKSSGELEITDEVIDVQELVNSCKDVCLQTCLERFLPTDETSDDVIMYDQMRDDLDIMTELHDRANFWRDEFNLGDMSTDDVFKIVQAKANDLNKKIVSRETRETKEVKQNEETSKAEPASK